MVLLISTLFNSLCTSYYMEKLHTWFLNLHSSAFDVFTYFAQIFPEMFYCLSKHFNFLICPLSAMQLVQRRTKYSVKYIYNNK